MSQAVLSLPQFSPFELLLADYEVAMLEKKRAYVRWYNAWRQPWPGRDRQHRI